MSTFIKEENVYGTRKVVFTLAAALVLALAGCGNGEQAQNDTSTTNAFDEAEDEGTPLEVGPVEPAETITEAMPFDQLVVSFD